MTDVETAALRRDLSAVLGDDPAAHLVIETLVDSEARADWGAFGVELLVEHFGDHPEPFPVSRASVNRDSPVRALVDARGVFAPLAFADAVEFAAEAADRDGIGSVSVRNAGPLGRLAPYALALARRGLVGLVASSSRPFVAPFGGVAPALGTNPLAVAMPTSEGGLVVDAASSEITWALWRGARETGEPLPEGAVIDGSGRAVTDPHEAVAILPRGGLVGALLGIAVEALTNAPLGIADATAERGGIVVAISVAGDPVATGDDLARRLVAAGGRLPGRGAGVVPPRIPLGPAVARLHEILGRDESYTP